MGTLLDKGSAVTIYISDGPQPIEYVYASSVVGWSYTEGKAYLERLGFVVNISGPADGMVVEQSGQGNLPAGASITLVTQAYSSGGNGGSSGGNGGGSSSGNGSGTGTGTGTGDNGQTGDSGQTSGSGSSGETTNGGGSSQNGSGTTSDGSGSHTN